MLLPLADEVLSSNVADSVGAEVTGELTDSFFFAAGEEGGGRGVVAGLCAELDLDDWRFFGVLSSRTGPLA